MPSSPEPYLDFARRVAAAWAPALEPRLCGIYALGSLAHGGFSPRYSDIDMGVVAADSIEAELERLRGLAREISDELGRKVSIFWTDRSFAIGRFPPLDRADYLDHRVTLVERERVMPARPGLATVRDYLAGQPLLRWGEEVERFAALTQLGAGEQKPYVRCLLYPARLLYSWTTGRMASNDDAVAFLGGQRFARLDLDLIERALACRRAGSDLDALFPERGKLAGQRAACAAALSRR